MSLTKPIEDKDVVNVNRRNFAWQSLGLFAAAGISSCGYHKVRMGQDTTSTEVVSSVLISADEKKLVVMTPQFHYVFDVLAPLVQAIKGQLHPFVSASFSQFHVDINGKTNGSISLLVANSANPALSPLVDAALAAAVAIGFTQTSKGAEYVTTLHGDRYNAGKVQPTEQYKLNKPYEIQVTSEGYGWKASPVGTVAGEFALGSVILFSLPIALVSGQKQ